MIYLCTQGHLTEGEQPLVVPRCTARVYGGELCGLKCRPLTDAQEAAFRLGGANALRETLTDGYEALMLQPYGLHRPGIVGRQRKT